MKKIDCYPQRFRRNINRLKAMLSTDEHTAYSMMLLTAALMDLHPWDEEVADIILEDCGVSPDYL